MEVKVICWSIRKPGLVYEVWLSQTGWSHSLSVGGDIFNGHEWLPATHYTVTGEKRKEQPTFIEYAQNSYSEACGVWN